MAESTASHVAVAHVASASMGGRALAALVGLGSASLAGWLAWHHPLSPALALAGVLALAAAQAAWPPLWLIALPALLPWIGLGAWSGWLVVEEMDLAILAVAAGAYLRWAVHPGPRLRANHASRRVRAWGHLLLLLWVVSVLVAMQRGAVDAGGWSFSWWQGYREPLNALRLAKPTLAVLLLLPLWWRLQQRPGQRCADQLSLGLALALAGITLWCIWERWAFPGLLNMSADYRTTGPFWETQVGGAALDVSLALTLPFALRLLWVGRTPAALLPAMLLVLGAAYAGFTTFSRIVILALPLGALVLWWMQRRQDMALSPQSRSGGGALPAAMLCAATAGLGVWLFPSAGYRGMLALLAGVLVLMLLVPRSLQQRPMFWVGAWICGLILGAVLVVLGLQLPKGAYIVFGVVTLATGALLLMHAPGLALVGGVGFVAQLVCLVLVAVTWGGSSAWPAAVGVAVLLALAWPVLGLAGRPPWPTGRRWFGGTAVSLVVVLAGVSVFGGGAFMADRLGQSEADRNGRMDHWRDGLGLNTGGTAQWLGMGLGRYADLYALTVRQEVRPGDLRLLPGEGGTTVRMVAGNHMLGRGELIRLSQRIARPPATGLTVAMQVRAPVPVTLYVELCDKHLLYDGECRIVRGAAPGGGAAPLGDWKTFSMVLPDNPAQVDFPPRILVFSVATESRTPLDLRALTLKDASGREWLHNGDFAEGGARWFISSDRNHLPWHAKNMVVHLLVEQGWLGLLALVLLTTAALAAMLGPQRSHPLAPPIAAAIVGCWVVGTVDSVLDIPRVTTWLLLLTGMALSLHTPSRARARGAPPA